ncbi:MAG TPA: hypothetical protein VN873_18095 [Candidatus Angelobacter sp.]|nr:hypothetical protein [Candidatus Angelobacter sp.]
MRGADIGHCLEETWQIKYIGYGRGVGEIFLRGKSFPGAAYGTIHETEITDNSKTYSDDRCEAKTRRVIFSIKKQMNKLFARRQTAGLPHLVEGVPNGRNDAKNSDRSGQGEKKTEYAGKPVVPLEKEIEENSY